MSFRTIAATFAALPLMPGTYFVDLWLGDEFTDYDVVHEAASFDVQPADVFGSGKLPPAFAGPIAWPARFDLRDTSAHANVAGTLSAVAAGALD